MKFSINWLKEYVEVKLTPQELSDRLTMASLEVDSIEESYAFMDTVVLGRITEAVKHPNADKLQLCKVDIGSGELQDVVCGAPNAKAGMQVAMAKVGTTLPNGLTLKSTKIRGEKSEGMLCSASELGLNEDHSGILDLNFELPLGTSLSAALGLDSATLEVDLTPNRVDCASIIGIAREVAAIQKTDLRLPAIETKFDNDSNAINQDTSVTVEAKDHCPRYAARLVKNVKIKPSPDWLKSYLLSVGLRPINNIVDITNFVLMECGQPLHAFDFDTLAENRIVVKLAKDGDKFTTLDGKERSLTSEMLMICDGEKPVGIAGVMGGLNSEITDKTQNVLIESAYFAPSSIRKTSKKLGLKTDASFRFERGVDYEGALFALDRAADLMVRLGEGELVDGLIDVKGNLPEPVVIRLEMAMVSRLLDLPLTSLEVRDLLTSVGFACKPESTDFAVTVEDVILRVTVPTFRVDVKLPEDLIEEIARLYGYDHIPVKLPVIPVDPSKTPEIIDFNTLLKIKMSGLGFNEIVSYNFIPAQSCDRLGFAAEDPRRNVVKLLNPLSEELAVLRSSLVPGLLHNMAHNAAHQQKNLKTFEIAKTFVMYDEELPKETETMAALWTGLRHEPGWQQENPADFYDLKGTAEALFAGLHINDVRFAAIADDDLAYSYLKPGHRAVIMAGERILGSLGELDAKTLKNFGLKQTAFVLELDIENLKISLAPVKYEISNTRFPSTSRDITMLVDKSVTAAEILAFIKAAKPRFMESAEVVAVFEGDKIAKGKKSVSFRMHYRSPEKTLEDGDVNPIHEKLSKKLNQEFSAQ